MRNTNNIADRITEELQVNNVFTVPIGNGIGVAESVVVTWGIMLIMVASAYLLGRNLKVAGYGRRQLIAEYIVTWLDKTFVEILGEKGKRYVPYMMTIIIYIGIANIVGLFGFKSPTKDMNVTVALALMSIILVQYAGIKEKGLHGYAKSFREPVAIVAPLNVMEIAIKPLSLCMRLFGNVLGSFVIMKLIEMVIPVFVPVVFSLYFDIFDGLLQAYVFAFLTSLYIKEAIE